MPMFHFILTALSTVPGGAGDHIYHVDVAAASASAAVFDGVGAISGGGGETVLLPHYPAAQRNLVLDYLLRPSFGASLHILKLEIGGDALSTDGAEPSHMHDEHTPPDFGRGYEWWVAKEARARNPRIKLYGLPWEWPAWVGAGATDSPYRNISKPLHYVLEWLRGARDVHQLSFDYLGVWNERECDPDYLLALREALDAEGGGGGGGGGGFAHIAIVAPDGAKKSAAALIQTMAARPDVAAAVHAVGYHYPDSDPEVPAGLQAQLGLTLWASEDDSTVDPPSSSPSSQATPHPRKQPGGACLVRTLNQNWVQGNITATIVWNLVMARYPQMRWDYTGLVAATDPFGGAFEVLPPVWAAAHTTQFTQPGWRLLRVGSGSGWLARGGTYVGYVGPATAASPGGDLTIVVEKMDANASKCERGQRPADQIAVTEAEMATFAVRGGGFDLQAGGEGRGGHAAASNLSVWASHFGGDEPSEGLFVRHPDVPIINGTVTIAVLPNWAYTLSTVRSASKGGGAAGEGSSGAAAASPPRGQFPAAYSDDFEQCALSSTPRYVAPMAGAFECVAAGGGRPGRSVRQMSPAKAICDRGDVMPFAVIGDGFRTVYNVSVDVLLSSATGGAFVGSRTKGPVGSGTAMDGVFFAVNATGWHVALSVGNISHDGTCAVASGLWRADKQVAGGGSWRRISLAVVGTVATAAVDGQIVMPALAVPAPHDHFTAPVAKEVVNLGPGGYASFGTVGYGIDVEFDNLSVESRAASKLEYA